MGVDLEAEPSIRGNEIPTRSNRCVVVRGRGQGAPGRRQALRERLLVSCQPLLDVLWQGSLIGLEPDPCQYLQAVHFVA